MKNSALEKPNESESFIGLRRCGQSINSTPPNRHADFDDVDAVRLCTVVEHINYALRPAYGEQNRIINAVRMKSTVTTWRPKVGA